MMTAAALFVLTAYPAFAIVEGSPSPAVLIARYSALPSFMAKIFPVRKVYPACTEAIISRCRSSRVEVRFGSRATDGTRALGPSRTASL